MNSTPSKAACSTGPTERPPRNSASQPDTCFGVAWAAIPLGELGNQDVDSIIGRLTTAAAWAGFESQLADQTLAWREELRILTTAARSLATFAIGAPEWTLLFEYPIPRRGKRIDVVLIASKVVVVLEFKIGANTFSSRDLWQTEDYVLDLRDFHESSQGLPIEAILVATEAPALRGQLEVDRSTNVYRASADGLATAIAAIVEQHMADSREPIDVLAWERSGYRPTPTIVESARRVFAGHNVRELSHSYADNLTKTTDAIAIAIARARDENRRIICFVTGVPGSGKTLAGLTAIQDQRSLALGAGAASFMSGNGPLVRVIRDTLVRDRVLGGAAKKQAQRESELLVQIVHQFLSEYGVDKPSAIPPDHVICFDEAQRAWHAGKLAKRHKNLSVSEPELVLEIMSRPMNWAVVVAMIGGGQEIHDGEAGLEEWGRALASSSERWDVVVSPEVLFGGESVAGHRLFEQGVPANVCVCENKAMHLSVSVRSPRAQQLAQWVNAVLRADSEKARQSKEAMFGFRIAVTRDLGDARFWLNAQSSGELRAGLLASSGALRSRAYGLELDAEFHRGYPIERWFLDGRDDFRSSHSLEVAMTEFECQGLELDYVGLCWGDDFTIRADGSGWHSARLRGKKWLTIRDGAQRQYWTNKYRVLLTRARSGMIIWVPRGDSADPTRPREPLDRTAEFLERCGAEPV